MVPGSVILMGGAPGMGKSTLWLQTALENPELEVLYVAGEENLTQVGRRLHRLMETRGISDYPRHLWFTGETEVQRLLSLFQQKIQRTGQKAERVHLIVVDSLQTLYHGEVEGAPGQPQQMRTCALLLYRFAKQHNIPIVLIGHVTKEGILAGPRELEHLVDVVLYLEGDARTPFRILRATKNRYGNSWTVSLYEMHQGGLRSLPPEALLPDRKTLPPGVARAVVLEGQQVFAVEVQALVSSTLYPSAQRSVVGMDPRRLSLLLAILERHGKISFARKDVFVQITGGWFLRDPALDMAVCSALISSVLDVSLPVSVVFCGEAGLTGEFYAPAWMELREAYASRMNLKLIRGWFSSFRLQEKKENSRETGREIRTVRLLRQWITQYAGKKGTFRGGTPVKKAGGT